MRRLITICFCALIVGAITMSGMAEAEGPPTASTRTTTTTTAVKKKPTEAEIAAWVAAVKRAEVHKWEMAIKWDILRRHHIAVLFRAMAAHARAEAAREAARKAAAAYPHGLCGGDLPPCYVMWRESRGDITAQNRRSTASGKWQFLDSTWAGYGGYAKARYAPERVQDDKARLLWNRGRGCSHWLAC